MRVPSSLLAPLLSLQVTSCSISTQVQYQDSPAGSRSHARTIPSGQYEASAQVDGTSLDVSLAQISTCERGQILSVHRTEHRLRLAHPSPWALVVSGIGLAALGAGVIFGGQTIAAELGFSAPSESPLTYQIAGGVVAAAGVGLILGGVIHAGRARESHRELGIIEIPQITTEACRAPAAPGMQGALALSAKRTLRAAVARDSRVRFSMLDVASGDLPTSSTPLALRIQDKEIAISLSDEQTQMLRNSLLADERSVARQELLAQQQEQCSQAFRRAQGLGGALDRAQVAAALATWDATETACGPLFSPEMAELRAKVRQAHERFRAEDAFFASARQVSDSSTVEELTGKVVYIEKTIVVSDVEGGYIKFESEETVCMLDEASPRTRWGRGGGGRRGGGGGRGGGHWWGGGGHHGGGGAWLRSGSRGTSYRSKSSKRSYGGRLYFGPLDDEGAEPQEVSRRAAPKPHCQLQKKGRARLSPGTSGTA